VVYQGAWSRRSRLDQLASEHGLRGSGLAPQACQHRQCDRSVQERQGDHDRGDHEGIAAGEFLVALDDFQRPVIGPMRGMDSAAGAAEQGVVNDNHRRCVDRHQIADDQPQHGQPDRIGLPAGGGEEPVRPAVMPHPGQPGAGQHAAHGSARRLGEHPGQQGHERHSVQ
jgi:hypothetical protein